VNSSNALLTVRQPIRVLTQPVASVGICGSGEFSLSVNASGSFPIFYQWRRNGVPIPGANSPGYAAFYAGGMAVNYDVVMSNACGSVTSAPAIVRSVVPITLFTNEPASQVVCQGDSFVFALFNLAISGDTNVGSLSYQWRKNGTNIPGARQFFYGELHTQTNDAGVYDCIVSNACGAVASPSATLTVRPVTVSVTASVPNATEGSSVPAQFTITRSPGLCGELTVNYSLDGTASTGVDYAALTGSVTLPARQSSATVAVLPVDDIWREGNETVVLAVLPSTNYSVSATGQTATVTIVDDDALAVLVSTNLVRVPEAGGASFNVQLNGPPGPGGANAVRVSLTHTSGDADISVGGSATVDFRDRDWDVQKAFTLSASLDADSINGVAMFLVSNNRGLSNLVVTAMEIDRTAPPDIAITCLTNGLKELRVLGYPGSNYVVQAASRLLQPANQIPWMSVTTNTANISGSFSFIIPNSTGSSQQFFRARVR
jgi:hypothetical protein